MYNRINSLLEFDRFRLDTAKGILWCENEVVNLPPKAVEVLCVLAARSGEVLSKRELLDIVWRDSFVEESNLTHQIYELRKLFKEFGCRQELIRTIPRRGYLFVGEVADTVERDEIIIERESVSQTLIAEIRDDSEKKSLPAADNSLKIARAPLDDSATGERRVPIKRQLTGNKTSNRRRFFLVFAAILLCAGGLAIWQYRRAHSIASISDVRSLAVLPIKSFDKTNGDDELRLRITDSLITKLGRLKSISVRPTNSVLKFVNSEAEPLEIGRILEVDAVLDGRIQQEGDKMRVTLQLLAVKTGEKIWSEQFDGETRKLLDLQDAISAKMLTQLNLSLPREQETIFAKRPTLSPEAFEEYLKGRYFWQKRTPFSLQSAISAFEKAIKLDPDFADAYVGLADSYFLLVDYSFDTSPKNIILAQENLAQAIALDPNLAEAHATLGYIQTSYLWNWKAAEESFLKAIEIAPNAPNAHHRYSLLLLKLRRFSEADNEMRRARELDPTSTSVNMNLGAVYFYSKRYDEAEIQLAKTLDLDPNFTEPHWYLARCKWMQGDRRESIREYMIAVKSSGDEELAKDIERDSNSLDEKTVVENLARAWEKQLSPTGICEYDLAILAALRGNREETLMWLEKSLISHHPWTTWISAEPEFDFVREELRFQEIMKKMDFQ